MNIKLGRNTYKNIHFNLERINSNIEQVYFFNLPIA